MSEAEADRLYAASPAPEESGEAVAMRQVREAVAARDAGYARREDGVLLNIHLVDEIERIVRDLPAPVSSDAGEVV